MCRISAFRKPVISSPNRCPATVAPTCWIFTACGRRGHGHLGVGPPYYARLFMRRKSSGAFSRHWSDTLFAFLLWHDRDGNPGWLEGVELLARGLRKTAIRPCY